MDIKDKKVALVHDFLVSFGGAERVLQELSEMFPEAPIFTLFFDEKKAQEILPDRKVQASFLQKFPKFLKKRYRFLTPFFPVAVETMDFREYDLVISSSGAWTKGIVTKLNTIHVSYIHSPMRFVWDYNEKYLEDEKKRKGIIARCFLSYLRIWDKMAAERPDYLLANSIYTQKRIKKYYRRNSHLVYPPVSLGEGSENFSGKNKDYFLTVSRLSPYKNIDKIVKAFNKLELPLVVIGEGRQKKYLETIANKNIKILGWQPDEKLEKYYQGARAFVFSSLDDFGIAPSEALRFGVPIIALRAGGALEIVKEEKTGEFFDAATPEVIADGVRRFMENEINYDSRTMIEDSRKFGSKKFRENVEEFLNKISIGD